MKADLILLHSPNVWEVHWNGGSARFVGGDHEQVVNIMVKNGFTEITEWHDGKQFCTHLIPKQTLGKGE